MAVLSRSRCVLYDAVDWKKQREMDALGGALAVAFGKDSASLVGIVTDGGKHRLRKRSLKITEPAIHGLSLTEPFYNIAVAADGSLFATGHDGGNIVLWNATTLDVVSRLQTGLRGPAHPFFSPDSALVAAGSQETGDVVIWNVATRQETARYTFEKGSFKTHLQRLPDEKMQPERDPTRFCFSPDGQAFLSGCYGGILRSVLNGAEIARFGE
jgi:WD40 repeat protein